ncbi:MAG: M48 family metallopeptidase [Verrucomicrobiae bacterium]|nr:M48 family metallopeptidase [Verrucomicrobiae bacterium]
MRADPSSKFVSIGLLTVILLLAGCVTEPVTGRKQLILLTPSQELELGMTSFEQMKREMPINKDPAINALVQKVGKRIAAVADLPGAQWEFVVFDSNEANAFCLPGGKVGVYTGILPITKDEAGLATVIGHEVAHAAARHGAERLSQAMLLQTGGNVVGTYLGSKNSQTQAIFNSIYGIGTQIGIVLPHSRTQESRADEIGLVYMARAGYNPEAAIEFWKRFAEYNKTTGGKTPWFLRTHPLDEQRIADLQKWLPKAKQEFRPQQ